MEARQAWYKKQITDSEQKHHSARATRVDVRLTRHRAPPIARVTDHDVAQRRRPDSVDKSVKLRASEVCRDDGEVWRQRKTKDRCGTLVWNGKVQRQTDERKQRSVEYFAIMRHSRPGNRYWRPVSWSYDERQ